MDLSQRMQMVRRIPTWSRQSDGSWIIMSNDASVFQRTIVRLTSAEAKFLALAIMQDQQQPLAHEAQAAMDAG